MPNDQGYNARLQEHGGPRVKGEQGNGRTLRQRGNSRAYILARLERDRAFTLLEAVLEGRISAYAAAVEMHYTKRAPPTGRVEYPNVTKRNDWAMHKVLSRPQGKAPPGETNGA
jgi:hypothetical protein